MFLRVQWQEMLGREVDITKPEEAAKLTRGALVIDAKALFDAAKNGSLQTSAFSMKDKYSALEILALVQNLEKQGTELRWCNSDAQLADGLTKMSAQDRLKKFLIGNQIWNLCYDEKFTSAKRLRRQAREDEAQDIQWIDLLARSSRHSHDGFRGVQDFQPPESKPLKDFLDLFEPA